MRPENEVPMSKLNGLALLGLCVFALPSIGHAEWIGGNELLPELEKGCPQSMEALRKLGDEPALLAFENAQVFRDGHPVEHYVVYGKNAAGAYDYGFEAFGTFKFGPDTGGAIKSSYECGEIRSLNQNQ